MKTLEDDLQTVVGLLEALPNLGGSLHDDLFRALEQPQGATFRRAILTVADSHAEMRISIGAHSISRLKHLVTYLSKAQLTGLLATRKTSDCLDDGNEVH
jgi:hypothetical protein